MDQNELNELNKGQTNKIMNVINDKLMPQYRHPDWLKKIEDAMHLLVCNHYDCVHKMGNEPGTQDEEAGKSAGFLTRLKFLFWGRI